MGVDTAAEGRSPYTRVRLYLRGAVAASAVVDEVNTDGMHVRVDGGRWALGTYLEVEPLNGSRGRVGAMVAQHTGRGVGLVFASWSPQLFELIHCLAGSAILGFAAEPQVLLAGGDDD